MVSYTGLFKLFIWNGRLKTQRSMQYRTDFIIGLLISLFYSGIGPLIQYLIFTQTKGYPGWDINQIILFQGVLLLWMGIKNLFFGECMYLITDLVWKGDFDRLLLKPYPPMSTILFSGFHINSISSILAGLGIIVYSMNQMKLAVGLWQIGLLLLSFICGMMFSMAIIILYSSIIILITSPGRTMEFFESFLRFGDYPLEIFPKTVQIIFMTVIPFAVYIYFPAQVLLNRVDIKVLLALLSSVLFFVLNLKLWNYCLRKYTSAGG